MPFVIISDIFTSNMMIDSPVVNDKDIEYDDKIIDYRDSQNMPDLLQYQEVSKNTLKAELKRRGVGYKKLADLLAGIGVHETERNIANKVSRGAFSAAFFLQCLSVIGCKHLTLEE